MAIESNITLKEVIDRNEWPAFFDELWKMPDWEHDYEDAEAKILIKEERLDLLKDMFEHKHWNLWELYPEYIKYVPKQDHAFVGEILFSKKNQRSSTGCWDK